MAWLDPVFSPLLRLPPLWAVILLSFLVSLFIVLIYRAMTDQKEMKQLKDSLKEYQTKLKSMKDKPEDMMKVQKDMMQVNMKYMGKSMKPTLVTFIPILLIFGWMNAHLAYEPIMSGQQFELSVLAQKGVEGMVSITAPEAIEVLGDRETEFKDGKALFTMKGDAGDYIVTIASNEKEVDKHVIIDDRDYAPVTESYKSDVFKSASLNNKQLKVIWKLSWLWTYIICAVIFSIVLRKAMKIY